MAVARIQYEDAARIQREIVERNPQKVAEAFVADEALVAATADTAATADALGGVAASLYATDAEVAALPGAVWDDMQVSVNQGIGSASLAAVAYRDTPAVVLAMASNGTDAVTFYAQMSHRWDPATDVHPHVHWVPLEAPAASRVVRFRGQYAWADPGEELPANAAWTTFQVDVTVAPGDEFLHKITPLATVAPGAAAAASSILVVQLVRDGASASDTYTDGAAANVGLLSLDVHYQSGAGLFGTVTEY